ncbi:MAG: triphosphoribosyl-dephospho-CoA synthase [Methylococcaceae bacterium]|nr:triphosphoribosyl-dephospho-CoA synthase [Methylococcaceae bacterium]MCI0668533.1 triphosphoribosyl-dephospho-CoA synthase [Methylococcaceae bacterium]MCI0734276.1 triphosphoribosyl-dephospho-CoA synthase [Methylococcaceae bacterium]
MTAGRIDPTSLRDAYLQACECEIKAFKPGNVSVYSEGHGMTVDDFRASAEVSADPLVDARLSLGRKIYHALEKTADRVRCNTNLGIVLLCAPLLEAMQKKLDGELRDRLRTVLDTTTVDDAEWVYRGIRLAKPAGLGESTEEDVHSRPRVSLQEAMRIASGRDRIAYQYVSGYRDVFETAKSRYHTALGQWGDEIWAAVAVFAALLGQIPDSHIERKYGNRYTGMVTTRMTSLNERLSSSDNPERLMDHLMEVDEEFKNAGINPGTTADLTVATLLAVRLERLLDNSLAESFGTSAKDSG